MSIPGINSLTAVREHHVIVFSNTYLLSRAVDGTQLMANQIAGFK